MSIVNINGFILSTGEFATQTCFQGRFGEETGSDQYGVQIIIHPAHPEPELVKVRISDIEVRYAGQAFRLGRYAIHFHLAGDQSHSYVRRSSINRSFNRALNIHQTHNLRVLQNVAYNIKGGAFFLEDSIETGNIIENNLAIMVLASSSLQNDDITPAAFWITNPNNTVIGNTAAGGSHFGFWYRIHAHPDGPSFDSNICPQNHPLGIFANNTAHSQGWFGLWIFQKYTPMVGGGCHSSTPQDVQFQTLTAWNCEKGAESVFGGALHFVDFFMVNNEVTGIEMKLIDERTTPYSFEGGSAIIGKSYLSVCQIYLSFKYMQVLIV